MTQTKSQHRKLKFSSGSGAFDDLHPSFKVTKNRLLLIHVAYMIVFWLWR